MNDPFRNYDAWLEAPYQRMYAEQEKQDAEWLAFVDQMNGPEPALVIPSILGPINAPRRVVVIPHDADNPEHPDHDIFQAWCELELAIGARFNRLQYEAAMADQAEQVVYREDDPF